MAEEFNLSDVDSGFEEKVYVIADEVLHILKELSDENRQQISSQSIAEKMFWRQSLKDLLNDRGVDESAAEKEEQRLKQLAEDMLNKFTELVPQSMMNDICNIRDSVSKGSISDNPEWLNSPIGIVKKYINSLSGKIQNLEEFIIQAMQYISETEDHLSVELSTYREDFDKERHFEKKITSNMDDIKISVSKSPDLTNIKVQLLNKIENINRSIEEKRKYDMKRLRETEDTIRNMSNRMSEIKREADEIRKRSQEIEFEAVRDGLTGLYNRKAYNERISETLAHVQRYDIRASMMICDIDHFKDINDKHGHKVGDLALKKLATLLNERLRSNDIVTRYGGEEFAVILPHTDLKGAEKAASSIREYIDRAVFSYKGETIPLTISIGVSSFKKTDDENSVFERADNALYLAKKSGRNMVKTEEDLINNPMIDNRIQKTDDSTEEVMVCRN